MSASAAANRLEALLATVAAREQEQAAERAARGSAALHLVTHADGWGNSVTGLGDFTRDKRHQASIYGVRLQFTELEELYRSDDVAARIIDLGPNEEVREGWNVQVPGDPELARGVNQYLADLGTEAAILRSRSWSRGYGGAGMVLGADDGSDDPVRPLDEDNLKALRWFTVGSAQELVPIGYYSDAFAPKFGLPEVYQFIPSVGAASTIVVPVRGGYSNRAAPFTATGPEPFALRYVHETRVIRFDGVVVSQRQQREMRGWGDSVLVRVLEVIRDFQASYAGAALLVSDFAQAVMRVKNLANVLASGDDTVVRARAALLSFTKSVANTLLLDADGEEYKRESTPVTGLPELLDRFAGRLAQAADTPVTILMGQAPAGLQATGSSDLRWFYDRTGSNQRRYLLPPLTRLVRLVLKSKEGPTHGKVPPKWSITFNPLWRLDDLQQAEARLKQAQADALMLDRSVVADAEVARSRFGGGGWSGETHLDPTLRDPKSFRLKVPNSAPVRPGAGSAGQGDPSHPDQPAAAGARPEPGSPEVIGRQAPGTSGDTAPRGDDMNGAT